MGFYNHRDLLGHFVKPVSKEGKMCPHACCRNKRVHPKNYPVVMPSVLLRRASDDDLAAGYDSGGEERRAQILYEMDRRDARERKRAERAEEAKRRLFARRLEHGEEVERSYVQAENATRGYMLNRAGREQDIDPRSLFTAPESYARRYASEELMNHWQAYGRPTAGYMRGKDTRMHARYTAPKRRKPLRLKTSTGRRVNVAVVPRERESA